MKPTLGNYIESINNPNTHFKRIANELFPVRDENGAPRFNVSDKIARFEVDWRGQKSLLCCFLSNFSQSREQYKHLWADMRALESEFLTDWIYLEDEILVFDERGNSKWYDVILQREPEGEFLDDFITRCCRQNDTKSIRQVFEKVYQMSVEFYRKGFVHRAITPLNIVVKPDLTPVVINYRAAEIISSHTSPWQLTRIDDDNIDLATLAIILYVLSYRTSLYAEFKGVMIFRPQSIKRALPRLYDIAKAANIIPVKNLIALLLSTNDKLKDRPMLNKCLYDLVDCDMRSYIADSDLLELVQDKWGSSSFLHSDFQYIESVGVPTCAKRQDGMWRYYNADGTSAFEVDFEDAYDFNNGLAVVMKGEYGMINLKGEFVIDPVCEAIEWWGEGVAIVSFDGRFRLVSSDGALVTEREFDWLGSVGEGVITAKIDNKYGYIDFNGRTVIDFVYDDAFGFEGGRALVIQGDREFNIDIKGLVINS